MTNEDRKYCQEEILKERWHRKLENEEIGYRWECDCICGKNLCSGDDTKNRTFTTPDDAYALEQALVRDGLDNRFWIFAQPPNYIRLLPEQRCQLIIDFYKEVT